MLNDIYYFQPFTALWIGQKDWNVGTHKVGNEGTTGTPWFSNGRTWKSESHGMLYLIWCAMNFKQLNLHLENIY